AALVDYSGIGNTTNGTVGTAPTIIANTGGIQCNGNGAIVMPAALNSAVTMQFFFGWQYTADAGTGESALIHTASGIGSGTFGLGMKDNSGANQPGQFFEIGN